MLKAFFDLESRVDQIPLAKGLGNTPSCVMPGDWMADVFELCGFTYQNMAIMLTSLNSCSDFIMEIQAQTLGAEAAAVNLAVPKMSFFMDLNKEGEEDVNWMVKYKKLAELLLSSM